MKLTYKYRAYPTELQKYRFENHCYILCNLYNHALQERKDYYKNTGKTLTYARQWQNIKKLKNTDPSLRLLHSQVLQDCLKRVDKAYTKFLTEIKRKKNGENVKVGQLRKKKPYRYSSFTYPQVWMGDYEMVKFTPLNNKFTSLGLPKFGTIKIRYHRPIDWKNAKTVTLKREKSGKYYICVTVEIETKPVLLSNVNQSTGIDVGVKNLITLSDGTTVENPRFLYKTEKRIKILQKQLSRKKKGSNNYEKQRIRLAKAHEKLASQRKDFLHKLAIWLVLNYAFIYFEKLNIKGLVKNHKLARSIHDSAWGKLIQYVTYKSIMLRGIPPVFVPCNGTTQICSNCGTKVPKVLSDRTHCCPVCGLVTDRDINAALNILKVGQELSELNACGDTDLCLPVAGKSVSLKQEAPSVREE